MAFGVTQAAQRPFASATLDVWNLVVALFRWRRRPLRPRHLRRATMSDAWLREHTIESSKHYDPLYG